MSKLSATSALVLLWASKECYTSKKAKDYLKILDLESGKDLYDRCKTIWPHYDEVIKNRKFGVFTLIKKYCTKNINCSQLIIAGAGLDALGIEITEHYPHVKVFELDKTNMAFKSNLLKKLGTKSNANITFIEANILDPSSLCGKLTTHGWNPQKPTLLILEGISYYLSPKSTKKLILTLKPNWTIFEFLKQDNEIITDRAKIAKEVFGIISNLCGLSNIWRYNYSKVEKLFDMPTKARYNMEQLEKMRTGSNRFFTTEHSGWIEVCLLAKNL